MRWITRVPRRLALVPHLERVIEVEHMQPSALPGYRYLEVGTWFGDVRQRWLVVYSETKAERDRAALTKRLGAGEGPGGTSDTSAGPPDLPVAGDADPSCHANGPPVALLSGHLHGAVPGPL
ncbi:MAG: hypothetical protein Q9O62_13955 [Ardenticatenia bacterium]|nr:hypothetical protein [Ardenticatenia bacterium]